MRSELLVVSWWSNCLGLTCLHNLAQHADGRPLHVVQVGKSEAQKDRFRAQMPATVHEIDYPPDLPAEHGPVIEAVARGALSDCEGLWFLDHDFFVHEPLEPWLAEMDRRLARSAYCLCHPQADNGFSITGPAFWLSPTRLPAGLPGFEPTPYRPSPVARRPDLTRAPADLRIPDKDTLVRAQEYLTARGLAAHYPYSSLPGHEHLGGLYLLANEILPDEFRGWMAQVVARLTAFYAACPPERLAVEDPLLLQRLAEFEEALS